MAALGGIPVSALSFVASLTLLYGLMFSEFSLFCFFFRHTHVCHRASHFSELVAIPLLCVLFGFWCCCVLVCFVCLFAFFGLFCVDGIAH